jgi:pyruvate/2-oxoglutarate dehydrogenase complex dihydrolipoamide acyltransferase (E2) component
MANILLAPALWASYNLPAGFITHWLVPDGAHVRTGDPLAEIQLDDGLHEIKASIDGKLVIEAQIYSFIESGSVLGRVGPSSIRPSQIRAEGNDADWSAAQVLGPPSMSNQTTEADSADRSVTVHPALPKLATTHSNILFVAD